MGESCEQGRVKVIGEQPLRGHVDGSEGETRGQGNGAAEIEQGGDGAGGTGTEILRGRRANLGQGCGTGQWGGDSWGRRGGTGGFPAAEVREGPGGSGLVSGWLVGLHLRYRNQDLLRELWKGGGGRLGGWPG